MFVNSVNVISSKLEDISLNYSANMQPKTDRPPVSPKDPLPLLHLTPPGNHQKRAELTLNLEKPGLLKPQHEIPPTPPPQVNKQPLDYFQERIG